MKYIVTARITETHIIEEVFVFPSSVDHDAFAESVARLKKRLPGGKWTRETRRPIAAGFYDPEYGCFGSSETLGLSSRGIDDLELIMKNGQSM